MGRCNGRAGQAAPIATRAQSWKSAPRQPQQPPAGGTAQRRPAPSGPCPTCSRTLALPCLFSVPPLTSYWQASRRRLSSSGSSSSRTARFSNSAGAWRGWRTEGRNVEGWGRRTVCPAGSAAQDRGGRNPPRRPRARAPALTRTLRNHSQHVCLAHVRPQVLIEHQDRGVADVVVRGDPPQLCAGMVRQGSAARG